MRMKTSWFVAVCWVTTLWLAGKSTVDAAEHTEATKGTGQDIGSVTREAALEVLNVARDRTRSENPESMRDSLEKIGLDATYPAQIRGAALTELAMGYENAFPSFSTSWKDKTAKYTFATLTGAGKRKDGSYEDSISRFLQTSTVHPFLNRTRAVELYKLAAALGNETAQFRMGTLYASGALGVEQDTVNAVLHYYFAAMGGHTGASMALGFRHSLGLGVPKNCRAAVVYYELAANQAVDMIESLGTGFVNERERLSIDKKSRGYAARSSRGEDEEVIDYYKHAAEKGDLNALVALGQIYFFGARGVEKDHARAIEFFRAAAANGDPLAQSNLGHMLVKGMGTKQDIEGAFANFTAAAEAGSAGGLNGLGYLYLYGLGVEQDATKARKYFNDAAEAGNAEALYNLGSLYITGAGVRRRNYPTAINYFSMAAQKGHTLAMHKLAQINLHGVGIPVKNCDHALQLFKAVAERGESVQLLSRGYSFWNNEDDSDSSLQVYLIASELGYETAQANAAWLLDNGASLRGGVLKSSNDGGAETEVELVHEPSDDPVMHYLNTIQDLLNDGFQGITGSQESLRLYQLAAEQGNVDARLKIGDYYYYGLGGEEPNFELAAHHYKQASDAHNAQALFNLGFMHQHGVGLPRDFHLAKRFYDNAESTHPEAKIPVSLALTGLWFHRVYRAVVNGEISSDLPPFVNSFAEWFNRWFGDGGEIERESGSRVSDSPKEESSSDVDDTGSIAIGLADVLMELEDDTIIALCLFILLVFVLLLRSREQARLRRQNQHYHEHQD